jgi:tRNA modification GTPase
VALITGDGPAAVAIARLSGPSSFDIGRAIFSPWPSLVRPKYALVGRYTFGDSGIALPFSEGASFTGEEVLELSVHGGRASTRALLDACIKEGARLALPGEFSLRAFMNGVIDLSQAEAIVEVVEAQTSRQLTLANKNLEGRLRKEIVESIDLLVGELAKLEASVDFSEEIGEFDFQSSHTQTLNVATQLSELFRRGRIAHLSRTGVRVALAGRPNAGKSSLLNAILGVDRAIVSEIAGTTRDTIEESVDWDGLKVILIDTAGLRQTEEKIETMGIERSFQATSTADEILYLFDSAVGWTPEDDAAVAQIGREVTLVANKSDLEICSPGIPISCLTREGLDNLFATLSAKFSGEVDFIPVNDRQAAHLELALETLNSAVAALATFQPPDLISVLLNGAIDSLGRVVGVTVSEDMLKEIFSRFCIGK